MLKHLSAIQQLTDIQMKVILAESWMDEVIAMLSSEEKEALGSRYRWQTGSGKAKVDISTWSAKSIQKLYDFLGKKAAAGDRSAKLSQNVVRQWQEISEKPDGQVVPKLENVLSALRQYIGVYSDNRYLFEQKPDGNFVPWFVSNIQYHEHSTNHPASVQVSLAGINTGEGSSRHSGRDNENIESDSFSIYTEDIRKRTMSQVLEAKGYHLETPERMESYYKETERFLALCNKDGHQMSVTGKAKLISGWYNRNFRPVGQNGRPAKMVMDPPDGESDADAIHAPFWDKNEEKVWTVPLHPVFEMFDLDEHADYRVHVNNTEEYVYDDSVDQKLVLPVDIKDFLTVLIEHSKNHFEDIVGGKEGGTIVLIEGLPGIGKTLTAEVYAEKMHRPLYKVQSSQLGTSPSKVEEQLKEVLQRAERWGAILLIDEADVYVHERGTDIDQNAIVGVFLRVLEYYRGVLFMTTNRGTSVDDAIISRTTARFEYEMPSVEDQIKIWKVMNEQNKVGLTDHEISRIVNEQPNLSGRDIKNLLKLSMVAAVNKKDRVTPEIVKFVSRFKQSGRAKPGLIPDRKVQKIGRDSDYGN